MYCSVLVPDFPKLYMRRICQLSCWFFYRFQHQNQILRSVTGCLMEGGHWAKLVLCQWIVPCLLGIQQFLWFQQLAVLALLKHPHFFLSLCFLYFPPKHYFMKGGCSSNFYLQTWNLTNPLFVKLTKLTKRRWKPRAIENWNWHGTDLTSQLRASLPPHSLKKHGVSQQSHI